MNQNKTIITFLTLIFTISAVAAWFALRESKVSAQEIYELALEKKAKGKVLEAKKLFYEAEKKSVLDPELVWAIAKYEAETGNSAQSQRYALKAWQSGKQDKECFLALIHNSGLPTIELQVEYGRKLLKEIESPSLKKELKADMHFGLKEYDLALELYQSVYDDSQDKRMAVKIAYVLSVMGKTSKAIEFLKNSETAHGLSGQGYTLLATLNFLSNKIGSLKSVFKRADSAGIKDQNYLYKKSMILTMLNESGKAVDVLSKLLKFSESPFISKYRVLYAYNLHNMGMSEKIIELINGIRDIDSAEGEGERNFYEMLIALKRSEIPLEQINKNIRKAYRLLSDNFIVGFVNAGISSELGSFDEALDFYRENNEPLAENWSRLVIDKAYALRGNGDLTEATKILEAYHIKNDKFSIQSLLLLRDLYLDQSKFEKALKVQDILEQSLPNQFPLKLFRVSIYMQAGSYDQALKFLENLSKKVSGDKKTVVIEAMVKAYLETGNYTKVLELTKGIESFDLFRAQSFKELGDLAKAKEIFEQVYKSQKNSEISKKYVFFLLSINKLDEALAVMAQSESLKDSKSWVALAKASINLANKNYSEAEKNLKIASIDKKLNLHRLYLESELMLQTGELLNAHKNLNRLMVKTPGDYRVYHLKAQCFIREGNFQDAKKSIKTALRLRPENPLLSLTYADILYRADNFEEAVVLAQKLQSYKSLKATAVKIEAKSLQRLKKFKEAFDSVKKLKPIDLEEYYLLKSDIYLSKNEPQTAVQILEELGNNSEASYRVVKIKASLNQEISDLNNYAFEYQQYLQLAEIFIGYKNYSQAAICYESALNINSDNSLLLNNFAWCLYKSGDSLKAELQAKKAYSLTPRNNEIIHTLARVLIKNKKYKECENLLSPVISRADSDVRFHYSLGEIYESLGNKKEALYHYRFALTRSSKVDWRLPVDENELSTKIKNMGK